jgi:hypothetical protein
VAHMGKFEPSVLVIPNPLRTERVAECLSIEVEYFKRTSSGRLSIVTVRVGSMCLSVELCEN